MAGSPAWASPRGTPHTHTYFIERELLLQVEIGALAAQVLLHHRLHALLLQAVCHVVEGVLVREGCQRLSRSRGTLLAGTGVTRAEPHQRGMAGTPRQPPRTLLISVMANTSSSVSAPLRCSRMAIRLDHGHAPEKNDM